MFTHTIWMTFTVSLIALYDITHAVQNVNKGAYNYILTSINSSVDPCDDFYSYACGNYADQHRSKYYKEITGLMEWQYNVYVANLLDTSYQHKHQVSDKRQTFVEKTRIYYKACRREMQRNLTRYFEEIKPAVGVNWPLWEHNSKASQWPASKEFNVWKLLGQLQSYGLNNALINQQIKVNENDEFSITLQPAFSEEGNTSLDLEIIENLLNYMGVENSKPILLQLQQIDEVLLNISKYTGEHAEDYQVTYEELKIQHPSLGLYVKELLDQELPPDTVVILENPTYFWMLEDSLSRQLKPLHICNYLMMKFLFHVAADSAGEFNRIGCVKDLRNKMDLAVNFLYNDYNYVHRAQAYNSDIGVLFQEIKCMLTNILRENNLKLSPQQLNVLIDKIHNLQLNIGNLPAEATSDTVEEFYDQVPALDITNYYKNHLLLLRHRFHKSLNYGPKQTHFIASDNSIGSSSGAFNVATQNMIILPFGSLAYPLYDVNYYKLYKYSLLGFILAHEVVHAIDRTGLNYDSIGRQLPTESDILENKNFQNSHQCLQSQLETDAINERVADIVGLRVVERTFYATCPNQLRSRLFYMNLAQFFCGKSDIRFVDHDTDAQRLHQIVLNSKGFAKAFKCKEGSKMYTNMKCRVY